jgi:predicted MFS family arabinose efflux permease
MSTEQASREEMATNSARRYENTLVGILFLSWGTVFLDRMSQLYLAPDIAREFRLSHEQIGLLASVLAITWAVSGLLFGAVSDRFGRKRILIPAVFAFSLLSWVSGAVHSFQQLLLVRALMGIAEGPTWSIMTALIEESSSPSRRGRNIGVVVSAAALVGLAVAPVLSTQVAARFGWRWAFFVAGIPGLFMGAVIWRFVQEPRRSSHEPAGHHEVKLADYFSLLRYRNIWLCCIAAAGFVSWLFLDNVFAPLYLTQVAHQASTTAGFFLGATGLGSFFLGFLFPSLSDRWGRKPVLLLMAGMSAIVPMAFQVSWFYSVPWLLAAVLFLANTGQGLAALIMVLVPTESVPSQFAATSIGLATFCGEIVGATVAPVLAGTLAERHGLGITLWLSAAGSLVIMLSTLFLKETASARKPATELQVVTAD